MLRGTTLLEASCTARFRSIPVTAAAGAAYASRASTAQLPGEFGLLALLDDAMPRSHRAAALCEDGLLLLFVALSARMARARHAS